MEKWLYLIAGGAVGTVSRYVLTGVVSQKMGTGFPCGTLAVNLVGCFVISFLDVIFEKKFQLNHHYRILLMTGFCGAFTTFSAIMLETSDLLKGNQYFLALGNILLSVILGFMFFKFGAAMAEIL